MLQALLVFIGAGCGGVLRWLIGRATLVVLGTQFFPAGTLVANVIACAGAGVLAFAGTHLPPEWRLFIMTGFLGGLSTMSTFSLETVELLRIGAWQIALLNLLITLVCCFGILWLMLQFSRG